MDPLASSEIRVEAWLSALDERHLSELTFSEVARALRALSSCYVERRARIADGGALGSAGKRAAFALFYAPLHFFTVRHIVRSLALADGLVRHVQDLGCGTGSAGAAWALESNAAVSGIDRNSWAVSEANWTYRQLDLRGRAVQGDIGRARVHPSHGTGVIAAYSINELPDAARLTTLATLIGASRRGAHILIVEPIARRLTPWWTAWTDAFAAEGGVADEWRVAAALPGRQRDLAKAAGLKPTELTARTLWLKRR
jgi:hypothetical protein